MKNILVKYVFLSIILTFLFSCKTNNKHSANDQARLPLMVIAQEFNTFNFISELDSVQSFIINPDLKQVIKGKQGTKITFSKGCFGKIEGSIEIKLKEFYNIPSMILHGLTTQTTYGEALETDGMIYLRALNMKGDTLEIEEGKRIEIQMPTKSVKKEMELFYGEKVNNHVVWNLRDEKFINCDDNNQIIKNKSDEHDGLSEDTSFHPIKFAKPIIDEKIETKYLVNYIFNISEMPHSGYINIDAFIKGVGKKLLVQIDKKQEYITAYLVFDASNTFLKPILSTKDGYLTFYPSSQPSTLVVLSTKGDETYFGMKRITDEKDIIDTIVGPKLEPITRQELTNTLMEKFGKNLSSRPSL